MACTCTYAKTVFANPPRPCAECRLLDAQMLWAGLAQDVEPSQAKPDHGPGCDCGE